MRHRGDLSFQLPAFGFELTRSKALAIFEVADLVEESFEILFQLFERFHLIHTLLYRGSLGVHRILELFRRLDVPAAADIGEELAEVIFIHPPHQLIEERTSLDELWRAGLQKEFQLLHSRHCIDLLHTIIVSGFLIRWMRLRALGSSYLNGSS